MFAITVVVFCVIISSNIHISLQCELCTPDNADSFVNGKGLQETVGAMTFAGNIPLMISPDGSDLLDDHMTEEKAAHKSGEIYDLGVPVTLDKIKAKLKDLGIFNSDDPSLTEREKKELNKLFMAVEIMTTSRARQPNSAQNVFSALRVVERAMKKQLKEGQISDTLTSKFDWDKISTRTRRDRPYYYIDSSTNMRIFNTD